MYSRVHAAAFGADKLSCCLLVGVIFEHVLTGVGSDAVQTPWVLVNEQCF